MAVSITHQKVTGKPFVNDPGEIRGFDWDQTHLISGVLDPTQLPLPTAATLGGVKSLAAVNHKFVTTIGTDGVPVAAQPAAADITGLATSATTDTTTQANVNFVGLTAAGAAADADTFPTNQGAANLKQTLGAIKTWIKGWIVKGDVGLGNVVNVDTTTQANVAFTGLTAAAAAADTDTFPTNQGAANLKQTFAAVKTWVRGWITKADVGLGNVPNVNATNYLAPWLNSASRTVISRLSEKLSALDFPATGLGIADDWAALQDAITATDANGSRPLNIPPGTFKITKPLFLNKWQATPVKLTIPGLKIRGSGRGVTIIDAACANGYAIAINPEWKSAFRAIAGMTTTGGGTLGASGPVGTLGAITPGSAYTNGTYSGVALTGGSGSGATANITVAGGAVTAVTLVAPGTGYAVGNTLSATAASIGGTGSGFSIPVASMTYYVQITMNDPLANEIWITLARPISITSTTSRINITLPATNTGYSYNIYVDTATQPARYGALAGPVDTVGINGPQTIPIVSLGSAHAVSNAKQAAWQEASISDLTIINSGAVANVGGISYFKVGYADVTNVSMVGLTGHGFDQMCYTGDIDGSFVTSLRGCKFDTIAGRAINAAGAALEASNLTVDTCEFNLCGTPTPNINTNVAISAISKASPAVITTSAAQSFVVNDQVYIPPGITGMTQLASGWYRAGTVTDTTHFSLFTLDGAPVDTTGFSTYTGGGNVALAWRPPVWDPVNLDTIGGPCAISYLGLIGTFSNLGFTQCYGTNIYVSEVGSSDNVSLRQIDFENTYGKALYIAGAVGGSWEGGEILSATALGPTIAGVQLGTGFNGGSVKNFKIKGIKVRSDVAGMVGFEQFRNTAIGTTYADTNKVTDITWQLFDLAGPPAQRRFNGFTFNAIAGQCQLTVSASNTVKLAPIGTGATMPMRKAATGEFVEYQVPNAGITLAGLTGLSVSTPYYFFLSNSALEAFPQAGQITFSTTPPVLDQGYYVASANAAQLFIGMFTSDASGNIPTTAIGYSQYPVPVDQTAWTDYTPTVTPSGGAFTGATITAVGKFKTIGKTCFVRMSITLSALGSGSPTGGLLLGLPVAVGPGFGSWIGGQEIGSAKSIGCQYGAGSSTINAKFYDGTSAIGAGNLLFVNGSYETS